MPTRPLNENDQGNLNNVYQWVDDNLTGDPITPVQGKIGLVPREKGIYFWFMHPDGYKALSDKVKIEEIIPRYEKVIGDAKFHLVYIGTAGTGKIQNSNLQERLKWHINQNHTESSVCSGALSTLRAGIGALLSDDLILPNTELLVNRIFEKYFKVYWIPYEPDIYPQIDNDEKILISTIKPLLNIINNPNASENNISNPSIIYRRQRNIVYQGTRLRLKCANNNKTKYVKKMPSHKTPLYNHQVVQETKDLIKFTVSDNQSIHSVVNGIDNLPKGKCSFRLYDSQNPNSFVYESNRNHGWRTTGSGVQNIYTYFIAPDTNKGNIPRWQVIQNEMIKRKIKEITVQVVFKFTSVLSGFTSNLGGEGPITADAGVIIPPRRPKITSYANPIPNPNENQIKVCFIVPCSSKKNRNSLKKHDRNGPISFDHELGNLRAKIINKIETCKSHTRIKKSKKPTKVIPIGIQKVDLSMRAPAYKLYSDGKLFAAADSFNWTKVQASKVYIISAMFGIIRADDYIPYYDLAMDDTINNKFTPLKFWEGKLDEIIEKIRLSNSIIYDLLGVDYKKVLNPKSRKMLTDPGIKFTNRERSNRPLKRGKWLKLKLQLLK